MKYLALITLLFLFASCEKMEELQAPRDEVEVNEIHIYTKFSVAEININGTRQVFGNTEAQSLKVVSIPRGTTIWVYKVEGEDIKLTYHRGFEGNTQQQPLIGGYKYTL